ncbi:MAG TPA: hypothetical protein VK422_04545 [Pyrinomonadaceae bacterium]|nr:hypothetical protein [Pyrinomonadaceae bacterium]
MKAYSFDLRQKVLAAALRGDRTIREVAESFGVGTSFVLLSLTASAAAPRPRSGSAQAAGTPGSPRWVVLDAKLPKADFRPGEPIPLELTLRNALAEVISIWDTSETDFRILIEGPGGARPPFSEYESERRRASENGGRRETLTIGPGEKMRFVVDVGEVFDIGKASSYTLVAGRMFFVKGSDGVHEVSAPAVRFRVLEPPGRKKRG